MKLKQDFTQIPNKITNNVKISDGAYRTLVYLRSRKFTDKSKVYPSLKTISNSRGVSSRTIQNHLNELKLNKMIIWKRKGYSLSNEYVFIYEDIFHNDDISDEKKFISMSKKTSQLLGSNFPPNNINVNINKNIDNLFAETRKRYPFLREIK